MAWQGWRTFGAGYVHDALGGRIGYGALDSFALRMTNGDWRDSAGATQTLVLNQEVASAVVVSGWSRADKASKTRPRWKSLFAVLLHTKQLLALAPTPL